MTEKQYNEILKRLYILEKQVEINQIYLKSMICKDILNWTPSESMALKNELMKLDNELKTIKE